MLTHGRDEICWEFTSKSKMVLLGLDVAFLEGEFTQKTSLRLHALQRSMEMGLCVSLAKRTFCL